MASDKKRDTPTKELFAQAGYDIHVFDDEVTKRQAKGILNVISGFGDLFEEMGVPSAKQEMQKSLQDTIQRMEEQDLAHGLPETFTPNPVFQAAIKENDSISHGNQLNEVIVQASVQVAPYFLRRNLLHNQETVLRLDDGGLLLACKNIHENEIVPIVQYWIPVAKIVSPIELQQKMEQKLRDYLGG